MMLMTNTQQKLEDTVLIAEFMEKFGQPVRDEPIQDPSAQERILRAKLCLEEVFELAAALAVKVSVAGEEPRLINPKEIKVVDNPDAVYDAIETADALSDSIVVVKGTGLQLGLPVDHITTEHVCPSNMSKLGPDGKPIYDEYGKIQKGPNFWVPNIRAVLEEDGWSDAATNR
jgi:predicted HAD superfamily Cof-like phosphohydrolase